MLITFTLGKGKSSDRRLKICPVPGCKSRPQRKLSQHIDYMHPTHAAEKKRLVSTAMRYRSTERSPGQRTLQQVLDRSASLDSTLVESAPEVEEEVVEEDEQEEQEAAIEEKGTRTYPCCDVNHPTFVRFHHYLTTIDGGARSEKTAKEMLVDVGKFLRYSGGPSASDPGWDRLTDRDQLVGFLDKLKRSSVGPEGQLSKLDGFSSALKFLQVILLKDSPEMVEKARHTLLLIQGWKTTLRRDKRKLMKKRLEDLSCQDLSLDEVNSVVEDRELWQKFDRTCSRVERGECISTTLLNDVTILLATCILFKNWQRPGAVANVTLDEFEQAKLLTKGSPPVYLLSVREHKTAVEGYAKLILSTTDYARIVQYKSTVRPVQDVQCSPLLFILCGAQPLSRLSTRIKRFGERHGRVLPSATRVRKIGATEVAMKMGDSADAHLVTRHMSHSAATETKYYQAIVGDKHSHRAYQLMEGLRSDEGEAVKVAKSCSDANSRDSEDDDVHSTPVQKRRHFTLEETNLISEYFGKVISRGDTPSLAECKMFIERRNTSRTPKNIQDKVKHLSRLSSQM